MVAQKILVVAPHPDDETLGCAGTLLKLKKQGCQLYWLIMTRIEEGSGYPSNKIRERKIEIDKVKSLYGFKETFQSAFPTATLDQIPLAEIIRQTAEVFNKVRPHTVFVPHRGDSHSDHRVVFEAVMSCTKSFRYPYVKKVLMYETISETEMAPPLTENNFLPNVYMDISSEIKQKLKIMNVYKSEMGKHPFARSDKNILALATFRGASVHVPYAEAFMLLKEIL